MVKYVPSLSKNNKLLDEFTKSYHALIYKVEKGKVHSHLDRESIKPIISSLNEAVNNLESTLGTGKENIDQIYEAATKALTNLEKSFNQELVSEVEEAADELNYIVDCWSDLLSGEVEFDKDEFQKAKVKWSRKKLISRLDEVDQIKNQLLSNEKRLEKDITLLEKDALELDNLMLKETNERRMNELYRKIQSNKCKIDSLNVRRSNFSACSGLLDLIYANAKEIIASSEYSDVDLSRAKAYLNLARLRNILAEPDKALAVLKKMEKDITDISNKTKAIDSKMFNLDGKNTAISADAMAYKEELLRKQREKAALDDIKNDELGEAIKTDEVKGEN